jgi:hypothetical protein
MGIKRFWGLAATFFVFVCSASAQKALVVGICPFYDDTGTVAGEKAATMLPVMFIDKAKSAGFVPVIVNPGPENAPTDTRWPVDVARMAGTDAVLVGQVSALATKSGRKASDATLRGHVLLSSHAAVLVLSAHLLDTSSGRELAVLSAQETVKGSWFSEAAARFTLLGAAFRHESFWFADTHFGQAITRATGVLISGTEKPLSVVRARGDYPTVAAGPTCRVTVRVIYKTKARSSKMYLLAVNGKEESLGINDGVLEVTEPSGPILIHVTVKDAPYRQPVQSTYYANSFLNCARSENTLAFEIGGSGEGVIRWP